MSWKITVVTMMNRHGDKGHPWRMPVSWVIVWLVFPSISTKKVGDL